MATFCVCGSGLSNTGVPGCQSVQAVTKKLIYVPLRDSAGTRNFIADSDVVDEAFLTQKINEADPSKRWYPSPFVENVEDTKGDSTFESLNSGTNIFIQEGARTFTAMHIRESTTFLEKLKSLKCGDVGVYLIDIEEQLTGAKSADGTKLYPIKIDKETFDPILMKATDTTTQKIQVKFEFDRTERDEDLRSIKVAGILGVSGLLDGTMQAVQGATGNTDSVTVKIELDYGQFGDPLALSGLVDADFSANNETTGSPVSISSVVESPAGTYLITFTTSQTLGDEVKVSVSKDGFEVPDLTITLV